MRFLFTCGGTAGHINPALGVAGRLKEILPDAEFLFVGADGMMETELVPREGYKIQTVTITNLQRSFRPKAMLHNLKTVKNVLVSTAEAKKIMKEFQPDVAIGTGGYVCYPVLKAAHAMGVPTLVHESNAVPGLTTKLLSNVVDCVMVGFEEAKGNYKSGIRVEYTGTPVRGLFLNTTRREAKAELGLPEDKPLILSVWGSLGSGFMNEKMLEMMKIAATDGRFLMIHSAGKRYYSSVREKIEMSEIDFPGCGMDVREYIYDMPRVMAAADLIICRSGASTLGELSALGRPAILIPSPNVTGNHQEKNARVLEHCGAAEVLLEGEFTAQQLYEQVCLLLDDKNKLEKMSCAMAKAGKRDATERIAELIVSYVE